MAQRQALQTSATVFGASATRICLVSENRMAAIINSSLDAILCIDETQCITVFNPAATALFECPAEQAFGTPLAKFLPDVEPLLTRKDLPAQAMLGEFAVSTMSGKPIYVEVSVSLERRLRSRAPLQDSDAEPTVLIGRQGPYNAITTIFARDLTAKKLAEAQRTALETQLRESQKMQAMGTMAGGIAHDFNNILSAILGNAELAMQDTATDAPAMTSLVEIERAGRRARDLVRQILTFSRNEPPKKMALQLAEVVRETARLVRVSTPPGVDFQVRISKETYSALADITQVEQALLNLCTNAILAVGGNKGTVIIELSDAVLDDDLSGRLGLPPGPYVTVMVSDTGNGMDSYTIKRIFEPFFTTRQVGQGTGLGLSVVHGIMQTHQGAIDVQSTPGQGSVFTLYFPATSAKPAAAAEPLTVPVVQGRGQHVMYVDDDEALVFLVNRVLTRKGFKVTVFTDPHEAQAALRGPA